MTDLSYSITNSTLENQLAEIRDFAHLLSTGVTSIDQIKVYFCGQPEAGKTTLSRSLCNKRTKFADEQNSLKLRTRGIDVMQVQLPNGVTCSFWDFAGQADYHVHNDIFMSSDASLFIILVDARVSQSDREKHATYWLQYILTQCPQGTKPNVLLLASHMDEVDPDEAADFPFAVYLGLLSLQLSEVFGSEVNFVRQEIVSINCLASTSDAMNTVRADIEQAFKAFTESAESKAPLICKQIIDILAPLRKQRVHFLTWHQLTKTMVPVCSDQRLLKTAIKYLHKIGDLYFSDRSPLLEIVIIDLPWLCHEVLGWIFCPPEMLQAHNMSRMLEFRALAEKGPVAQKDIPIVNLFEGTLVQTLDVLEHFEICTPLPVGSEKHYLFPSLLRSDAPENSWARDDSLAVHVGLRFCCSSPTRMIPPGLFNRLQIYTRRVFAEKYLDLAECVFWCNGLKISSLGVQSRIILSTDARSIYVHVRGSVSNKRNCRKLLQRILACVQGATSKSSGISFDIEHSNSNDLAEYATEAQSFSQASVIDARTHSKKRVMHPSGYVDSLSSLLALNPERKL